MTAEGSLFDSSSSASASAARALASAAVEPRCFLPRSTTLCLAAMTSTDFLSSFSRLSEDAFDARRMRKVPCEGVSVMSSESASNLPTTALWAAACRMQNSTAWATLSWNHS